MRYEKLCLPLNNMMSSAITAPTKRVLRSQLGMKYLDAATPAMYETITALANTEYTFVM